ncbi:MAG: RNA polymerase sigma factor [Polyangiaceae bacterium]|nr:RNA polymerase sigma factor [Polyangiaceae bacterium]
MKEQTPPARPDPDAELVDRALLGDRHAFDALVTAHRDAITRLCRRYVRRHEDAEDVAQRAFLNAFEKLGDFRRESTFRTWLHRIAVNLALNHVRHAAHEAPIAELDDLPTFTNALETSRLVAAEVWNRAAARIAELPPKQRLVVELRLFHELSFGEIAVLADCSEDSAKVNFHHGIKRLREWIPNPMT